jgi:hypothetical protein
MKFEDWAVVFWASVFAIGLVGFVEVRTGAIRRLISVVQRRLRASETGLSSSLRWVQTLIAAGLLITALWIWDAHFKATGRYHINSLISCYCAEEEAAIVQQVRDHPLTQALDNLEQHRQSGAATGGVDVALARINCEARLRKLFPEFAAD